MSYYDFDYFWTHEEVGGQKSEVIENAEKFSLTEEILKFFAFWNNNNNQTKSDKSEYSTTEKGNYSSRNQE